MTTVSSLATQSLRLINAFQPGETPSPDDIKVVIEALNTMLDSWSADRLAIYSISPMDFRIVAGKRAYTLGPSGDWAIPRPMRIDYATVTPLYPTGTQTLSMGMNILQANEWINITVKGTTSNFPVALYDDGKYPNRTISLWPIPNQDNVITLFLWSPLNSYISPTADLMLPPGYEMALKFNLACEIAAEFGKDVPTEVNEIAQESLGNIKRLNSIDIGGMNNSGTWNRGPSFNYVTGGFTPWVA